MQTFLPYADFEASARALDRQRLGKQRVEVMQILNVLTGRRSGWRNHPAVRMWRGHEQSLAEYGQVICAEWTRRGHADTCAAKIAALRPDGPAVSPHWLGREDFHLSHQSKLVRKDSEHYRPQFPDVPDDLDDVWPIP